MQPRSPEASDARNPGLARPRRRPRGGPRRRDFLTGDALFAFLEPGDDLRIHPIGDADHDVAHFVAAVILDHGHRGRARPQSGFRVVPPSARSAPPPAPTAAATATGPSGLI